MRQVRDGNERSRAPPTGHKKPTESRSLRPPPRVRHRARGDPGWARSRPVRQGARASDRSRSAPSRRARWPTGDAAPPKPSTGDGAARGLVTPAARPGRSACGVRGGSRIATRAVARDLGVPFLFAVRCTSRLRSLAASQVSWQTVSSIGSWSGSTSAIEPWKPMLANGSAPTAVEVGAPRSPRRRCGTAWVSSYARTRLAKCASSCDGSP